MNLARSTIEAEIKEIKLSLDVLVPSEDVVVTVTKDGYVKRTSLRSYTASNREDFAMKESDYLLYEANIKYSTSSYYCLRIKETIFINQFMNCQIFAGKILDNIFQVLFRLNQMKKL